MKYLRVYLASFFVCVVGLGLMFVFQRTHYQWLITLFVVGASCSLGLFLGAYHRERKNKRLSRSSLKQIMLACLVVLLGSVILFLVFDANSWIPIILINAMGLFWAIRILSSKANYTQN